MKEAIGFTFNGTHSSELGVVLSHTSNSLFSEQGVMKFTDELLTNTKTGETVLEKTKKEPFSFTVTLLLLNWQQAGNYRELVRWLVTDNFKEFRFDSHPDKVVFAKATKFEELNHNGLKQGYLEVEFTTNSATVYSEEYSSGILSVAGAETITINNKGDVSSLPKIWIIKNGSGEIKIQANNSPVFKLEKINNKEKLFIDNKRRIILSSQEEVGVYRANNHNGNWLEIPPNYKNNSTGGEKVRIEGNCTVEIKWREEYLSFY